MLIDNIGGSDEQPKSYFTNEMPHFDFFSYESPIEMIVSDIKTQMDNDAVKVVQSYGFNVDKEELTKALAYDRNQYQEGYYDGVNACQEQMRELEALRQEQVREFETLQKAYELACETLSYGWGREQREEIKEYYLKQAEEEIQNND